MKCSVTAIGQVFNAFFPTASCRVIHRLKERLNCIFAIIPVMGKLHVRVGGEDIVDDLSCVGVLEEGGVESPSLSALLFGEGGYDSLVV